MSSKKYGTWKSEMTFPYVQDCIFLDIETDLDCSKIWLIGVKFRGNIAQYFANNPSEERDILEQFAVYLDEHPAFPLICYSTTNFDFRVLWKAASRLKVPHLQKTLRNRALIDLGTELRRHFKPFGGSYSLKMLRFLIGYKYDNINLTGADVSTQYYILCKKYGIITDNNEETSQFKTKVLRYNEDDVNILEHILHKFQNQISYSEKFTQQTSLGTIKSTIEEKLHSINIADNYIRVSVRNQDLEDIKIGLMTKGLPLPIERKGKEISAMYWSSKFGYEMFQSLLKDLELK